MAAPPVDVLRRALERAIQVAVSGEAQRPPVRAPRALQPVLRFRRLPESALRTVAKVLDTDDEFRARVAAASDPDDVGRVAWLWLERPEGWEQDVDALLDERALDHQAPQDERAADKALRRQLEGAERRAARALEDARRATAEAERLRRELDDVRAERAAQAKRIDELERRITELTAERAKAVAELKHHESVLSRRTEQKRALEAKVDELRRALDAVPGRAGRRADASTDRARLDDLRLAVAELRRRAAAFAEDLDDLHRSLAGGNAAQSRSRDVPPPRVPVPVPAGLTDDSVEAARYLITRPNAVLLVDGYNVSMVAWPDADIAEQRARLERLLDELAARTAGLTVELVFDGAAAQPVARTMRPGLTVRFTAADVEADDELLDLVGRFPNDRPVIVVSNDRRVRDGARARGANVLTSAQLMGVCGSR